MASWEDNVFMTNELPNKLRNLIHKYSMLVAGPPPEVKIADIYNVDEKVLQYIKSIKSIEVLSVKYAIRPHMVVMIPFETNTTKISFEELFRNLLSSTRLGEQIENHYAVFIGAHDEYYSVYEQLMEERMHTELSLKQWITLLPNWKKVDSSNIVQRTKPNSSGRVQKVDQKIKDLICELQIPVLALSMADINLDKNTALIYQGPVYLNIKL